MRNEDLGTAILREVQQNKSQLESCRAYASDPVAVAQIVDGKVVRILVGESRRTLGEG